MNRPAARAPFALPLFLLVVALAPACESSQRPAAARADCPGEGPASLAYLAGSYGAGGPSSDAVVTFRERDGDLLMHPALWSGPMVLRRMVADSFVVPAHPEFGVTFDRGSDGCVTRARVRGLSPEGSYDRLDVTPRRPVRLVLDGRPAEAARRYVASDSAGAERFVEVGRRLLRARPTRPGVAVAFLGELGRLLPGEAAVHAAFGDALTAAGRRDEAVRAYERALALEPEDPVAIAGLTRLGVRAPSGDGGWELPFDLDALFALPTGEEIAAVKAEWRDRDLAPREVEIALRRELSVGGVKAEARVVTHRIHGSRHVGVVLVPDGAAPGSLPVLVEAKGVSPSFFPLVVPDGLTAPGVLGEAMEEVVLVAPGYRGERVVVGGDTLASDGDRSDAWDGATDDLLGFLRAALEITPEADASRVCVFGRSRGGAVALLAGIRDRRVNCVVSWAAPTDWFRRMGLMGWSQRELVADGLRTRAVPGETGGQFIDYFLSGALAGRRDLRATRAHMIASSPLYFAEELPLAQVHWGIEDAIVPVVNGRDFVERHRASRGAGPCLDARFHPEAGHDQDRQRAPRQTREFLLRAFGASEGEIGDCRA